MWEGRSGDMNPGTRCVPRGFAGDAEAGRGCGFNSPRGGRSRGGAGTSADREFIEDVGKGREYGTRESRKGHSRRGGGGDEQTQENHREVKWRRKDKEGISRKSAEANTRRSWGSGKKGTGCAWEHGHGDLEC